VVSKTRVFVAGHNGMVGAAIARRLSQYEHIDVITRTRSELDLLSQSGVQQFFQSTNIDVVYMAAAKVGGIIANSNYPAEFIYENLMIECNIIHSAYLANVKKLLFLGSSCIYPKLADQPMKESALLGSQLEQSNEPYAIAKIAGIKLCESYNRQYDCDFRSIMPTNLYGPNDNFHKENSHVIPALLRRFHEAKLNGDKEVVAWGSGTPKREFLHVDDMASASVFIMGLDKETYLNNTTSMLSHINVGTGTDCSIQELVETVAQVTGFTGDVIFDKSKPDGTPRKLMDTSLINSLGWKYSIPLEEGLMHTYRWFLENTDQFRK